MSQQLYISSDSIVVVGADLYPHEAERSRFGIVSEALVLAVDGEKTAHYPRVVLHPDFAERHEVRVGLRYNPILLTFDDGLCMVQPFVIEAEFTLDTYCDEVRKLGRLPANAKHPAKWAWMLSVADRVERHFDDLKGIGYDARADQLRDDGF
ncbi:MAG TPA: hypothetical protein VFN67_10300 [Polyangiales bacterium]|nr:hypothetical protein [Polyangiales bacterium]